MHEAAPPVLPVKQTPGSSPGWFAGALLAAVVLGVCAVVFFFNPSRHGFYPVCAFHQLTGLNCPGCGMTRGLHALLHGNLPLAFKDNALLVLVLPGLGLWLGKFLLNKWRGRPATLQVSPKVLWALLVLAAVFAAVRNLPGFEWLSP